MREYVIKAQILAGGRGKGVFDTGFKGGVHLTKEYVVYIANSHRETSNNPLDHCHTQTLSNYLDNINPTLQSV